MSTPQVPKQTVKYFINGHQIDFVGILLPGYPLEGFSYPNNLVAMAIDEELKIVKIGPFVDLAIEDQAEPGGRIHHRPAAGQQDIEDR